MRLKERDASKAEVPKKHEVAKPGCVEDHSDDAENDSEEFHAKNPEIDEWEEDLGSTEEIVTGKKLGRSNSSFFDKKGTPSPIKPADRNTTEEVNGNPTEMKDMLIISVISLEAGASHYKNYHKGLQKKGLLFNAKVEGRVDEKVKQALVKNVTYSTQASYAKAFSEMLKNKEPAHCVPIIEGSRNNMPKNFEAECASGKKYQYILNEFHIDGQNGRKDARQCMHFYLRADMQQTFSIKKTIISHEEKKCFAVAEIMFSTIDEQKFSVIVVHIPNAFIGSVPACNKTDAFIRKYAENRKKEGVQVIAYLGDTNYEKPIQTHSCPSLGGNQERQYVSPTASGASEHTHFMQVISTTKNNDVRILQPSALNSVFMAGDTKEKTDHPSFQCQILLGAKLQSRKSPAKNPIFIERRAKSSPNLDTDKSTAKKGLAF